MAEAKRILVTGAAGFIGMHQALLLARAGYQVHGVDNLNPYYDPALKQARLSHLRAHAPGFTFSELSVENHEGLGAIFASFRPEIVLHLAAQAGVRHSLNQPFAYTRANVDGFLSILECCRAFTVEHLVYASSSSVYGANSKVPFSEEDPVDHPVSLYAATKRANELMAETYAHLFRIPATGLRFFTVYGPWGRPDMATWLFTDAILAGREISVFDEEVMQRDFTYIDDITAAIARLLPLAPPPGPTGAPHRLLNIGNHRPERLNDFISTIEQACGRKAVRRSLPRQPGDVIATYADTRKLAALTGFAPNTPIHEGIAAFVAWYRQWKGIHAP